MTSFGRFIYSILFCICIVVLSLGLFAFSDKSKTASYKFGKLKYQGGGDWYGNRTALNNLIKFCNTQIGTNFALEESVVEVGSPQLFAYPIVYMTGHGNVLFSDSEAANLRKYLIEGGFLHIDDNYGLDRFIRPQMKKVFPDLEFVELPHNHKIYQQQYKFSSGLPKFHEHDGKRPQGFALIWKGRVVCFYSYESDLGNGWEDFGTYPGDTEENRIKTLKMGANIVMFAFTQ